MNNLTKVAAHVSDREWNSQLASPMPYSLRHHAIPELQQPRHHEKLPSVTVYNLAPNGANHANEIEGKSSGKKTRPGRCHNSRSRESRITMNDIDGQTVTIVLLEFQARLGKYYRHAVSRLFSSFTRNYAVH